MEVVQGWFRHSNFETTADIYTHVSANLELQEASKLNAVKADNNFDNKMLDNKFDNKKTASKKSENR